MYLNDTCLKSIFNAVIYLKLSFYIGSLFDNLYNPILPLAAGNGKYLPVYRSISLSRCCVCSRWRRAASTADFTWYSFIKSSRMGLYLA